MCIPRPQCQVQEDCASIQPYTYCRKGYCFKNICFDDKDCEENDKCHLHQITRIGTCNSNTEITPPGIKQ